MDTPFGRVVTAMVTPFNSSGDVDYDEAVRLAQHLADNGSDCILLAGTTGESPTLTHQEEYELFKRVKSELGASALVMAGTGSNSTKTAVEATQKAAECGVDGVLQVVPYYNKPSQEGLFQHFKAVSESTKLPIMLYNIPGRTGTNMQPETTAKLAQLSNIVAIKEASGSVEQVQQIREQTNPTFYIYSGDDALTLDFVAEGACGVVSVASHLVGVQIKAMIEAFLEGRRDEARRIETQLMPLFQVLFITSNPSPVKAALAATGFNVGDPRLPLVPVTESEEDKVLSVLRSAALV